MKKVYIASPYTKGDMGHNIRRHILAFVTLLRKGFLPFAPLLLHFVHIIFPLDYEECMAYDLEWLKVCDVMLRLEGESSGADREEQKCEEWGIPVVYSIKELEMLG